MPPSLSLTGNNIQLHPVLSTIALLFSLRIVSAQDNRTPDPENHFIYPPLPGPQFSDDPSVFESNLNFTAGVAHSQPFKWTSTMGSMFISLNQEGNPNVVLRHNITKCQAGYENFIYWDGNIGAIDLANGAQAYLAAWNCSDPFQTPVFFSHYINLLGKAQPETSSSSSATPTHPSSTTGPALPTLSTPNEPSPQTSSPVAPANTAAIGGGVGGGFGGALLILAGAFAYRRHRNKNQEPEQLLQEAEEDQPAIVDSPEYGPTKQYREHLEYYKPSENDASMYSLQRSPAELPSNLTSTHNSAFTEPIELSSDTTFGNPRDR